MVLDGPDYFTQETALDRVRRLALVESTILRERRIVGFHRKHEDTKTPYFHQLERELELNEFERKDSLQDFIRRAKENDIARKFIRTSFDLVISTSPSLRERKCTMLLKRLFEKRLKESLSAESHRFYLTRKDRSSMY